MTTNIPVIPLKVVDQAGVLIAQTHGIGIPRIGEGLMISGVQYRVADVIHVPNPISSSALREILIYVQDFTQPTPP